MVETEKSYGLPLELLKIFLEESAENLEAWEQLCLSLGPLLQSPQAATQRSESMNALFRVAHTLKGSSKCALLNSYGDTIHAVEDVITRLRDNLLLASPDDALALFFDCHAVMVDWQSWLLEMVAQQGECLTEAVTLVPPPLAQRVKQIVEQAALLVAGGALTTKQNTTTSGAENLPLEPHAAPVVGPGAEVPSTKQRDKSSQRTESIKVPAEKLEDLVQLIGELSVMQSFIS